MPVDVNVHGHDGFNKLAAGLNKVAAIDYDLELNRGLENAGEVVAKEIRTSSDTYMPKGYEKVLSGSLVTKVDLVRGAVRRAVVGVRAYGQRGHDRQVEEMEKGRLKHPVFTRAVWVWQRIRSGFVTEPAQRAIGKATEEIDKACKKIANKIERIM